MVMVSYESTTMPHHCFSTVAAGDNQVGMFRDYVHTRLVFRFLPSL